MMRSEFREEPQSLMMPVRKRASPILDAAAARGEPETIRAAEVWSFDLTVKENPLPSEQGVLDDGFGFTASEVRPG